MRRLLLPASVVVAAVALIVLLAFGVSQQGDNTSLDAQVARGVYPAAPSARAALPVLGPGPSKDMSLVDFRGRVVVLNVFASWCDPCKAEAPILEQTQQQLAGTKATVLGVTYLDNPVDSARFVAQEHITYPVIRDVNGDFVRSFGDTTGVPETFVIDGRGHVEAVRRYEIDSHWLGAVLARVLGRKE